MVRKPAKKRPATMDPQMTGLSDIKAPLLSCQKAFFYG